MKRLVVIFIFCFLSFVGCGGSSGGDSIEYAALGASDVVGVGATPLTNGYVYLIEDSIEEQQGEGVDLNNLGIPAAEVGTIKRVSVEILKRSATPNLITLSTGANDVVAGASATNFEQDLGGLLAGINFHPVNLLLTPIGLGHRRIHHLDHDRSDVKTGSVSLDVRDDGIVGDVE